MKMRLLCEVQTFALYVVEIAIDWCVVILAQSSEVHCGYLSLAWQVRVVIVCNVLT